MERKGAVMGKGGEWKGRERERGKGKEGEEARKREGKAKRGKDEGREKEEIRENGEREG